MPKVSRITSAGMLGMALWLTPVLAEDDVTAPVRAIMNAAVTIWSDNGDNGEPVDYFDAAHIGNFSTRFQSLYAAASNHPAHDTEDGTGSPFDYDPILSGQDGCTPEEVSIEAGEKNGAATDVIARFKRFKCFEGDTPEVRNAVSQVRFRVIVENGKPVIDDVITGEGNEPTSIAEDMKEIAGADAPK